MKIRFFHDGDEWVAGGPTITAPATLEAIRSTLEHQGPIIVEHWFYRGASAPDRLVFDDFEAFTDYLNSRASAGDMICVWNFAGACRTDNMLVSGKCPDDAGRVPKRGAY